MKLPPLLVEIVLWVAITVSIAVLIGYETEWGRHLRKRSPELRYSKIQLAAPELTAPFRLQPADRYMEFAMRPLFVVTRRPAPPPPATAQDSTKPAMTKGQFDLVGTTITPAARIAFLFERSTNKVRSVTEGSQISGITVKQIAPESVLLTQYEDEEQLTMRTRPPSSSPKPTAPAPGAKSPESIPK